MLASLLEFEDPFAVDVVEDEPPPAPQTPLERAVHDLIAELAEHATRIRRRISENFLFRARDRIRRLDVAARRAETERLLAELRATADRVDRRITEAHPNPELKQAWAEVRQIGRRMGLRPGGR